MTTLACLIGTQGAALPKGYAGRLFGNGEGGCVGYSLVDDLLRVYNKEKARHRGRSCRRVNGSGSLASSTLPPRRVEERNGHLSADNQQMAADASTWVCLQAYNSWRRIQRGITYPDATGTLIESLRLAWGIPGVEQYTNDIGMVWTPSDDRTVQLRCAHGLTTACFRKLRVRINELAVRMSDMHTTVPQQQLRGWIKQLVMSMLVLEGSYSVGTVAHRLQARKLDSLAADSIHVLMRYWRGDAKHEGFAVTHRRRTSKGLSVVKCLLVVVNAIRSRLWVSHVLAGIGDTALRCVLNEPCCTPGLVHDRMSPSLQGAYRRFSDSLNMLNPNFPPFRADSDDGIKAPSWHRYNRKSSADAWVYVLSPTYGGHHGRLFYIGCSARADPNPSARYLEHMMTGWRISQGYERKGKSIPMYVKARTLARGQFARGLSVLVFWPQFGLTASVSATADAIPKSRQVPARDVEPFRKRHLLGLELLTQRRYRPGLCAPWIFNLAGGMHTGRKYVAISRPDRSSSDLDFVRLGFRKQRLTPLQLGTACPTEDVYLVYCSDLSPWRPSRTTWRHQFETGVLCLNSDRMWSSSLKTKLMVRLCRPKGAKHIHPILRHAAPQVLDDFLWFVQTCHGDAAEEQVYKQIQEATRGRRRPLRLSRILVRQQTCATVDVEHLVRSWLRVHLLEGSVGLGRVVLKLLPGRPVSIAKTVINEGAWMTQLDETVACQCDSIRAWATWGEQCAARPSTRRGEKHFWWAWTDILSLGVDDKGRDHPLHVLLKNSASAFCGDHPPMGLSSVTVRTTVFESRQQVIRQAADAVIRILRTLAKQNGFNLPAAKVIEGPLMEELEALGDTGRVRAPGIDRSDLLRVAPWSRWVVSSLDKGRWSLRAGCPRLAFLEGLDSLHAYHRPAFALGGVEERTYQTEMDDAVHSLRRLWPAGVPRRHASAVTGALCRSLPKRKDPARKVRLVVSYAGMETTSCYSVVARALEGLVLLCLRMEKKEGSRPDQQQSAWKQVLRPDVGCGSTQAVMRRFRELNLALAECPWQEVVVTVSKQDFVTFFQEVDADSVAFSVKFWTSRCVTGRRGTPGIRITRQSKQPLEIFSSQTRQFVPEADRCQLGRPVDSSAFTTVLLPAIEKWLELDRRTLVRYGGMGWQQCRGLQIGSPFGGSGCASWTSYRERICRGAQRWSLRDCSATATSLHGFSKSVRTSAQRHSQSVANERRLRSYSDVRGLQQGVMHKVRWVDDRFAVFLTRTRASAQRAVIVELLTYSGLRPEMICSVAQLVTTCLPASGALTGIKDWCLQLAACLVHRGGISQTQEPVDEVVGVETHLVRLDGWLRPMEDSPQELTHPRSWRMMTRMQLKDAKLALVTRKDEAAQHCFTAPRFPPMGLDTRSRGARIGHLLGVVSRLVDCSLVPDWALSPWPRSDLLDELPVAVRKVWYWIMRPWAGTLAEAWTTGVTSASLLGAIWRFQHCARVEENWQRQTRFLWLQFARLMTYAFFATGTDMRWFCELECAPDPQ